MDRIIGGQAGRLFINLREEKGYTYGAGSYFSAPKDHAGYWLANAAVRTEVTDGASLATIRGLGLEPTIAAGNPQHEH